MDQERLVNRLLKYVSVSSETFHEKEFCLMLEDELTSLGIAFERQEVGGQFGSDGWNILAKVPGEGAPILLSSHMDTVSPGVDIKPSVKDGVIYSDGSTVLGADDKAGIAAALEAVETIMESGSRHRPVELLFSLSEEEGMLGAKHADYSKIKSKEAIVLDDETPGHIVDQAAANRKLYFKFYGKAAHAGVAPEEGCHALKAAIDCASQIPIGHVSDISVANISNFISEGPTNVIADSARFDMEVRSYDEAELLGMIDNIKHILDEVCPRYGVRWEYREEFTSGAFLLPDDAPVRKSITRAMRAEGVEPVFVKTLGGCDMTWLVANGINAVNIGTGMTNCHTVNEYIKIEDLVTTTKILISLLTEA